MDNRRKIGLYGGAAIGVLGGTFAAYAYHAAPLAAQIRAFVWSGLSAGLFGVGVIFARGWLVNTARRS
jgi:hypothetical protein